ncbi:MAG: Mur ligase [Gemmatimonas sp.]|nr:Mur ligase [Gemmatimonas sp.]
MTEFETPPVLSRVAADDDGHPSATILDSRRQTGANWFSDAPGAVLEVRHTTSDDRRALERWPREVRRLCEMLGWPSGSPLAQPHGALGVCFFSAPLDGLLTATTVAEQAWVRAEQWVRAQDGDALAGDWLAASEDAVHDALRARYNAERAPLVAARAMLEAAVAHACSWQLDEEFVSVGSGVHGTAWPLDTVPSPEQVAWDAVRDVPVTLVTGSNGKTTTTRLVAAMWRAAGCHVGWSCSDGVFVHDADGTRELADGDYTGPGGARLVLRDRVVQAAVLETARGGMLRRGLATSRAHAAVITNISADHFGEYGVESLGDLARVKATVARILVLDALLVLNADDEHLRALGAALEREHPTAVAWFSRSADNALVLRGVQQHGYGAVLHDGHLLVCDDGVWGDLGALHDMPLTLRGAATHNVENAIAASLTASVAGVPFAAVHEALRRFGGSTKDNAGRMQRRVLGDVTVLVDYAHNPEGMRVLGTTAMGMAASRRLLLLGQAGNRDDAQLVALAQAAWDGARYDRVLLKEMAEMLRGRQPGDVIRVLRDALVDAGAPAEVIEECPSELEAVQAALRWAQPGDLLVLPTHVQKDDVEALLDALVARGWRAGMPLVAM